MSEEGWGGAGAVGETPAWTAACNRAIRSAFLPPTLRLSCLSRSLSSGLEERASERVGAAGCMRTGLAP